MEDLEVALVEAMEEGAVEAQEVEMEVEQVVG